MTIQLRLLHETTPSKYFPALYHLHDQGEVELVGAHSCSVFKEWLRGWVRERSPLKERNAKALDALFFRLTMRQIAGERIVLGLAPWDWRLLIYRGLARRNRILYQTSWHDWRIDATPRQPVPRMLKRWLRKQWIDFLSHPNVEIVAVTPASQAAVMAETGNLAHVIPHAVPEVFFKTGAARPARGKGPLRLLFVGEVCRKKGIGQLLALMKDLAPLGMTLTVVGDGAMSDEVRVAGDGVHFLGPIRDRGKMARVMAEQDVLLLLSQRQNGWEELFGIVIVEALAAGLAVIASDHIGPRGIFAPVAGAGLVDEADLQLVTKLLKSFAETYDEVTTLQQCQAPVADAFAIDAVAKAWLRAIKSSMIVKDQPC